MHNTRNGDITIRVVTIDANGDLSEEGHKILDDLLEQGWRSTGMTVVSSTAPITLAVMLTLPPRRPMQMRPPQFEPKGRQPQMPPPQMPISASPVPPPAPAPANK